MNTVFMRTVYIMTLIQLSRVGAQFVDSFIVSRSLGHTATSATGLVGPYFTVVTLVAGLIATGCQSICSRSLGKGNKSEACTAFSTGIVFSLIVSFSLGALVFILAPSICASLGARGDSADILPDAVSYLRMLALTTPGLITNFILSPIIQLEGGTRPINIVTMVTFVGDVIFDIIAVVLGWGISGIGFATTAATYLGTLIYIHFFRKNKTMLSFSIRSVSFKTGLAMLRQGGPEAGKRLCRLLRDFLNNYFVLLLGTNIAMAGKTVGITLTNLLMCPAIGVSMSVYLLSGLYIGEKNLRGMKMLVRRMMINIVDITILTIIVFAIAPLLLDLFLPTIDPAQQSAAIICVRAMLVQMPFQVAFEAYTTYLQSIRKRVYANVLSFSGIVVFYIPAMLLLGSLIGPAGTIISIPVALLLALSAYYIFLWIRIGHRPTSDDVFFITELVGSEASPELCVTVESLEDMAKRLEEIRGFLMEEEISPKTINRVTLVVEELCLNTITHGFPMAREDKKIIDIRILVERDEVILRIQDNCRQFNVAEKYEEIRMQEAGPEGAKGLILVNAFANDIRYLSTLKLNNLIISMKRYPEKIDSEERKIKKRI